jgi:tetratricopeptide (TPR) repeat protein
VTARRAVAAPTPVGDRWRLEDEREFLVRSLADAEREHDAGDLSRADYEALRRRDLGRLAEVEASLAALDRSDELARDAPVPVAPARDAPVPVAPAPERNGTATGARRRRRWWLAVVGGSAIAAGVLVLLVNLASPQLPGQAISGSVDLNPSKQIERELAQAAVLADEGTAGSVRQALAVYRDILSKDPNQPQALAETGWLEWEAGALAGDASLVARGKALVERSLAVRPDDYAAHFFLGTILLKQGDQPAAAAAQYRLFLAEGPPAGEVATAAPFIRQAFATAGLPLPGGVPAG